MVVVKWNLEIYFLVNTLNNDALKMGMDLVK